MCGNTQHEGNGRTRTATRTKGRIDGYATIWPEIKLNGKYNSLCGILSERARLTSQLSEKLITQAMRGAFDDWENIAASGNPGEWVIGCALQHYRTLGLPDEDSSWTDDVQPASATAPSPGAQPGNTQATAMRVAGALATSASLAPVLTVAKWEADHMLTEIYLGEYRQLVRLAVLLLGDEPTAEEVVQEAFIAMHTRWRRLRDTERATSYLRQAVVNRSRSVLRHRMVVDKNAPKHVPDEPSAEAGAITLLERSAVIVALRSLSDRQREAIVLRYYADLSEAEIAAALGVSRGAAKSLTARGMAALKSVLEQQPPLTQPT